MNILFIIGGSDKGGVLTWLKYLAYELTKKSFVLSFAASIKGESYTSLKEYGEMHLLPFKSKGYNPKIIAGIPWYSLKKMIYNRGCKKNNSKEISKIIDKNEIDWVITIGFNDIPKLEVKRKRVQIISVLHTVPRIDTTPFKLKSRFIAYKLSKVDKVVSVGYVIIERLNKYLKEEIILIPNSCKDFSLSKDKKKAIKEELNIPLDSKCIGSLGRFSRPKGFLELIKIFNTLALGHPNLHCVLGGSPFSEMEHEYFKDVKNLAVNSPYSNRIHFLGNVNNEDFYPIIDIYLLISINSIESFGLVAIEAMSSNIPVVATGIGGPLEIIEHNKTGFLVYNNRIEDFSKFVSYLLLSNDLYTKIANNGREAYLNRFTNEIWVTKWLHLFETLGNSNNNYSNY
jgi:glycosyltransferase involved in cell wall biosynthesis